MCIRIEGRSRPCQRDGGRREPPLEPTLELERSPIVAWGLGGRTRSQRATDRTRPCATYDGSIARPGPWDLVKLNGTRYGLAWEGLPIGLVAVANVDVQKHVVGVCNTRLRLQRVCSVG